LRAEVEAGAQFYARCAPLALEALGALAAGVVTA
jgi:hypothetical protein